MYTCTGINSKYDDHERAYVDDDHDNLNDGYYYLYIRGLHKEHHSFQQVVNMSAIFVGQK